MSEYKHIPGGEKELLLAASLIRDVLTDTRADPLVVPTFLYNRRPEDRARLIRKREYAEVAAKAPALVSDYFDREPADFFEAPPEVLYEPAYKSVWYTDKDGPVSVQALCERYFENELLYRLFKIMHGEQEDVTQLTTEDTNWVIFKEYVKVDVCLF